MVDGDILEPARFIELRGIGFTDVGLPGDASVRIHRAVDIAVVRCRFHDLGGGGIHATSGSKYLRLAENIFERIGQTGVILSGTRSTRPSYVLIEAR